MFRLASCISRLHRVKYDLFSPSWSRYTLINPGHHCNAQRHVCSSAEQEGCDQLKKPEYELDSESRCKQFLFMMLFPIISGLSTAYRYMISHPKSTLPTCQVEQYATDHAAIEISSSIKGKSICIRGLLAQMVPWYQASVVLYERRQGQGSPFKRARMIACMFS